MSSSFTMFSADNTSLVSQKFNKQLLAMFFDLAPIETFICCCHAQHNGRNAQNYFSCVAATPPISASSHNRNGRAMWFAMHTIRHKSNI